MGALGRQKRRSWSLRLARSRPLFKKSQSFARLFRVLSREPSRPGSILGRSVAPGLDFGGRNAYIFELFRYSCARGANRLRHRKSTVKTNTKRMSELARDDAKSMKNCSESSFDGARCSQRAWALLLGGPGASSGRPEDAFGRLLAALAPPGAPQDRPLGGVRSSTSCPQRVRMRPRNGLERSK